MHQLIQLIHLNIIIRLLEIPNAVASYVIFIHIHLDPVAAKSLAPPA